MGMPWSKYATYGWPPTRECEETHLRYIRSRCANGCPAATDEPDMADERLVEDGVDHLAIINSTLGFAHEFGVKDVLSGIWIWALGFRL